MGRLKQNSMSRLVGAFCLTVAVSGVAPALAWGETVPAPVDPLATPAEVLPAPTGTVILTVRGEITQTNGESEAALDLAMLEDMGITTMRTGTIWTEGSSEFQGIELYDLMQALGGEGETLRLVALNEYAVEIPMAEAVEGGPMLAFRMDGEILSPRDKGPLWMIYPFDLNPAYQNEINYARSIWQLAAIEVLP